MSTDSAPSPERHICDIFVAGSGAAGLTAALSLARSGFSTIVSGPVAAQPGTRTVALFEASLRFLDNLGVREAVEGAGAPLEAMRIIDDTDSVFPIEPATFRAQEIGLDAFGWNIENHLLLGLLRRALNECAGVRHMDALAEGYQFGDKAVDVTLSDGSCVRAKMVIAADGARSPARQAAGIGTKTSDYRQTALTAVLAHATPHENISTEFHTREGPFTLVPLPARTAPVPGFAAPDDLPYRCSLVWMMRPGRANRMMRLNGEAMADAIRRQGHAILGDMALLRPVSRVPITGLRAQAMIAPRLALVGEAAHVFPPIGAQGLNLGLRDVAHLQESLPPPERLEAEVLERVLAGYARRRRMDVASRTAGVDLLDRTLLTDAAPADFARSLGLMAISRIGPLRRRIMREGILPGFGAPDAMRLPSGNERPADEP